MQCYCTAMSVSYIVCVSCWAMWRHCCDALHCSELVACMGRKGLTIKISKANTKCRLPPRSFREYNTSDLQIDFWTDADWVVRCTKTVSVCHGDSTQLGVCNGMMCVCLSIRSLSVSVCETWPVRKENVVALLVPAYPGCPGSKAVKWSLSLSVCFILSHHSAAACIAGAAGLLLWALRQVISIDCCTARLQQACCL